MHEKANALWARPYHLIHMETSLLNIYVFLLLVLLRVRDIQNTKMWQQVGQNWNFWSINEYEIFCYLLCISVKPPRPQNPLPQIKLTLSWTKH